MEHNYDIEEFDKGGRISPEMSATNPPTGTLGLGLNGNVWINQEDKNGRLSWKTTDITSGKFSQIYFEYNSDTGLDFVCYKNDFFFKLTYKYNSENYIVLEYDDQANSFKGDLKSCYNWFKTKFEENEFNNLTGTQDGALFETEVEVLFDNLNYLIKNKGLRSLKTPTPEPKFKVGDKVKLPKTKNGQTLVSGMSNVYDDAKKQGQDYLVVTEVWDNQIMLDTDLSKYGDYFSQELDNLELYEEMPNNKFEIYWVDYDTVNQIQIGKVQQQTVLKSLLKDDYDPSTVENFKKSWEKLNNEKASAIKKVITRITWTDDKDYYFNLEVNENKTPFQQIDFLSPSTEEYSKLITGMINYSDGLKFNNSRSGVFKLINKDGSETEFSFIFNEVDNTISLTPIGRDDLITVSKKITNENIEEIAKIYWDTFTRLTKIGLKFPPKDCEADPNKIISGQVKKFYDLNKTRIEKLDSKFSCKIVQALVSLSEYESCGSPSSSTLPKAKSDLLSRIANLKV
jgi:hypothetical protein